MAHQQIIDFEERKYSSRHVSAKGRKGYEKRLSFQNLNSNAYVIKRDEKEMNDFVTSNEFNQFDKRISDKINDIRIDTNKIPEIDKSVYQIKVDLSTAKSNTNALTKDFSSVKSDVVILKNSAENIEKYIKDEFTKQKNELSEFKTEIKDEVVSFKSTTTWLALGIIVSILISNFFKFNKILLPPHCRWSFYLYTPNICSYNYSQGVVFMELDYRQIPYEQLNSYIPQGRGMIKWAPFATMPEQYEVVNQLIHEQSLSPEPKLTNDTILNDDRAALQLINQTAIVRYWSSGQEVMIECEIIKLDKDTQSLIVRKNEQILKYLLLSYIRSETWCVYKY